MIGGKHSFRVGIHEKWFHKFANGLIYPLWHSLLMPCETWKNHVTYTNCCPLCKKEWMNINQNTCFIITFCCPQGWSLDIYHSKGLSHLSSACDNASCTVINLQCIYYVRLGYLWRDEMKFIQRSSNGQSYLWDQSYIHMNLKLGSFPSKIKPNEIVPKPGETPYVTRLWSKHDDIGTMGTSNMEDIIYKININTQINVIWHRSPLQ